MNASGPLPSGNHGAADSTDASQAQRADDRIEPFLFNAVARAVRGADAHLAIDRIPERKSPDEFGGSSIAAVRTVTGPIHPTSGSAYNIERERSRRPLFQLYAALLI